MLVIPPPSRFLPGEGRGQRGEIPLALMFKLAKALLLQVCIDPTYKIALTLLFLCKLYQTLINFIKLYLVRPAKNNFLAKLAVALLFFLHDSPMPTRFVYVGLKSTQNSEVPSSSTLFYDMIHLC